MGEQDIKEILLRENEEFRKVYGLHQKYEKELKKFKSKSYMSDKEKLEEKELKKKKLVLKDKLYSMITEYKKSLQ